MMALAARLIAAERMTDGRPDTAAQAAFRVSEKLRRPLSTLAGVAGFNSLLSRAWVLAKAKAPWLGGLQISDDGSIQLSPEMERALASEQAGQAAGHLVHELLQLLTTFIGEALTLRLVKEVWPEALQSGSNPEENFYEKKS